MDTKELNAHVARETKLLQQQFAGAIPDDEVAEICRDELKRLSATAKFNDLIPLLVYAHGRNRLVDLTHDELHRSA